MLEFTIKLLKAYLMLICYVVLHIFSFSQRNNEWIWKRRLEYAEVEQKVELHVPFYEVQALMLDREKHLMMRQKDMETMLNNPETSEKTMSKAEFYDVFEKWLDVTRNFMDDPYSLDPTKTKYSQVSVTR